ncbi:MAG: DUF1015 domain-containing protein [Acidimicrobiia bacterium]|nr:DUF1015 domain-containing protein [Acidimicrobiia bacterium]
MAKVFPFRAYRYAPEAGPLDHLATQPYDKITPAMQDRYLSLSKYNLVRIILGKRAVSDSDTDNVYTRAAAHLKDWIGSGILKQDAEPGFYAYYQEFEDPDTGERCTRKGFIGACQVEEYSAGVVHRHEQTLSGPKKDRLELLRHTEAHFGQIFMLYPDPAGAVDRILDEAASHKPDGEATDDYKVVHRLWRISDPGQVARIQELMEDKKLVIADGHHRYETALAYSRENPKRDAQRVMMTFVNMNAPGLRILATHRLVNSLEGFDGGQLVEKLKGLGTVTSFESAEEFKAAFSKPAPEKIRIGVTLAGDKRVHQLEVPRKGALDVNFLHQLVLDGILGIGEEAVREQKYLSYFRGLDAALDAVSKGEAQVGFLLEATTVEQVGKVSFGGAVMPQKSTDFYPKLLSGMTVYKLES